jgi:hypothetical protein
VTALASAQRDFLAAVLSPDEPESAGLATYRRNVLGARRAALASAHPVTLRLVGEAFFDEAARRYALATPSESGDLHGYGAGFAGFLAAYPHARGLPYLADVARLEWAVHESSFAADGAALDYAALASVPPESLAALRPLLHPASRLVRSEHAILAIWEANQPGRDGEPDRAQGPDRVLVRREGTGVRPIAVDEPQWALLEAFAAGASLGDACAALADPQAELAPALARIATLGALGGFASSATA